MNEESLTCIETSGHIDQNISPTSSSSQFFEDSPFIVNSPHKALAPFAKDVGLRVDGVVDICCN